MASRSRPADVLPLTDGDAARLLALALATWSAQGEAEASDGDGRSWVFQAVRSPLPGLLVEASRVEGEDVDFARETVGQVALGGDAEAAVAGALAVVAARLVARP